MKLHLLAAVALAFAPLTHGQIASENFETANTHGWAVDFGAPAPRFATGGNPGGRIEVDVQSANSMLPAAMIVPTAAGHPWQGDFRAMGVTSFAFDRQVEIGAANFGTRPNLVLGSDAGTPNDVFDDIVAFIPTGDVFQFGMVPWQRFTVTIPSSSTVLDVGAGWSAEAFPNSSMTGASPDALWNAIITDVDYVGISMDRPWGGAAWFGAHLISLDNLVLEGSGPITTNYCGPGVPNSSGLPGVMAATGSSVVSANDLTLVASDLPANQFGIFITSRTAGFTPGLGGNSNGNLCLGGTIGRFVGPGQILSTGTGGTFSLQIDLTALPEGAVSVAVAAGETWRFQAWHRDGVGVGSNLTDGLAIDFQ